MHKRRYEILLPLRHNDGSDVAPELLFRTRDELVSQFGAVSTSPNSVLGVWVHEGDCYEDELARYVVDVDEDESHREFFTEFKRTLLERFKQIDIDITSYVVEII